MGPSPLRGISLSGRDPRDGIVSMHRGCRHKISRVQIDAGIDGESIIFEVVEKMCIKDEVSQMDGS